MHTDSMMPWLQMSNTGFERSSDSVPDPYLIQYMGRYRKRKSMNEQLYLLDLVL